MEERNPYLVHHVNEHLSVASLKKFDDIVCLHIRSDAFDEGGKLILGYSTADQAL